MKASIKFNNNHNNYHRNHMNKIFYKNTYIFRSINQSLIYFASLGIFKCDRDAGRRDYKISVFVTKLSLFHEQQ